MSTHATAADVLAGSARWSIEQGDCLAWLASLPADSADLLVASPPYSAARLYLESGADLGIARNAESWCAWMVEVTLAALRVCRGLIVWVVEGQTVDYRWDATPMLLAADLVRRGVYLRRPCYYRRVGIPGSGGNRKQHAANGGGADWFRADAEICLAITRGGKLPWADATACGHPPRWSPGGAMSNRLANGARVNQWGDVLGKDGRPLSWRRGGDGDDRDNKDRLSRVTAKPSHVQQTTDAPGQLGLDGLPIEDKPPAHDEWGRTGQARDTVNRHGRKNDGSVKKGTKPRKIMTREREGQHSQKSTSYSEPVLANPGNVIQETYTAQEVDELLGQMGEFVDCKAGGGQMGSSLAHANEAPMPLTLANRFVLSFCPPGGIVIDCFAGSSTTGHAALAAGRRYISCDLRESQVRLSRRRLAGVTPALPGLDGE